MSRILNQRALNFISKAKRRFSGPEYVFLGFAIPFGFLFIFLTPPLQAPDENSHFLRAYQVSDLNLVGQPFELGGRTHYGAEIPVSVNNAITGLLGDIPGRPQNQFDLGTLKDYAKQPLEQEKTQNTIIEAAGVYSPIVYMPQALGIGIGKMFDASPLLLIWLGRIVNFTVWLLAVYFAIRMFPFAKWAIVAVALNPVALFMAASLSPDATNIGIAFLFVSLVMGTFKKGYVLTKKHMVLLVAILSILALSKPVNLLFGLLLFAIPMHLFKTKLKFFIFCLGGILLAGILFALWNAQIRDILDAAVYSQSGGKHIVVKEQLQFILGSPFEYVKNLINNYILITPNTYGDAVLTTYFGVFGWLDTSLPLWTMMVYLLLMFIGLLYQFGRGDTPKIYQKIIFLGVLVLGFVGNITAMYFNATPVGSQTISGVQGRYFIPFIILLLIIFSGRKKILQISNNAMVIIFVSVLSVIFLMTTYELASRYY